MELPSFYDSAAQIVQRGLNEKLPPGWEEIRVLGGVEVLKDDEGEEYDDSDPAQCILENRKAYVLINLDEIQNELGLGGAAEALKLLTHEIAGHAVDGLRALSRKEEPRDGDEDHSRMMRAMDGSEGENNYLTAIRKVLPHVNVRSIPGLREEILTQHPYMPSSVSDSILDHMLKREYLDSCIRDMEDQVLRYVGSDEYVGTDKPDPAILERYEKLIEPMKKAARNLDDPAWRVQ